MSHHKVESLPKWAQQRLKTLAGSVEYWKLKAQQIVEGDTNVFQRDYSGPPPYQTPMQRDAHIIFVTDEGQIDVGFRDGELQVSSSNYLAVEPKSSNLIQLRVIQ